jgi:hypothetical protein
VPYQSGYTLRTGDWPLAFSMEGFMTQKIPTISGLREAVKNNDASTLKSYYADNAVMTVIDSINTPSKPRTIKGAKEIGAFIDDVYSRDMTHAIDVGVLDGKTLAFVEHCKYSNGMRVIASNTAELGPKGIVKQTTVQAWDN